MRATCIATHLNRKEPWVPRVGFFLIADPVFTFYIAAVESFITYK